MQILRFPLMAVIALAATAPAQAAEAASQATGEYSKTITARAPVWRAPALPSTDTARMQYGELAVSRLFDLQRKNEAPNLKAIQIGIGRRASYESAQSKLPALTWRPVAGGTVAKVEIRSMDALALRVGLDVSRLDSRVELRFGGSARPSEVVAMMTGAEVKRLPGTNGLFWSPNTDGDTQFIEIFRPKSVPAFAVQLDAPTLSHLIADSRNNFKIIEKAGDPNSCNIDTTCRVSELGPAFINAKNAVAKMVFIVDNAAFACTGTLVADTVPLSQIPYFYTADHCFSSNSDAPPVTSQMQAVANTLNTIWNYEMTSCNSLMSMATTQLSGGAAYLYSNTDTDGMLLRLNNAAPSFAYFSGWNAALVARGSSVVAIHHPLAGPKKVADGQSIDVIGQLTRVGWLHGSPLGGSSGSGLLTLGPRGYVLRGGLSGGFANCSNSGTLGDTANRDYYSRLDVDFPSIKTYLEPQPEAKEGARARTRPRAAALAVPASSNGSTSDGI